MPSPYLDQKYAPRPTTAWQRLRLVCVCIIALCGMIAGNAAAFAQTASFTYQGRLNDGGSPANGSYDFQFKLFDALVAGNQVGSTNSPTSVNVASGVFSVALDFGAAAFPGANRWLEISSRLSGSAVFTTLTPRQAVTATPYAIKSLNATAADGLSAACTGCVTDAQITGVAGSKVTGTIPAAGIPSGSANYIQNTTTQQAESNFNVSGNGTIGGNLIANGNVGISTTTPLGRLQVATANDTNPVVTAWDARHFVVGGVANTGGIGMSYDQTNGIGFISALSPNAAWRNLVLQYDAGNVGIGTRAPGHRLSVNGMISADHGDLNNGALNNGMPTGTGLIFGRASGEGIASKRMPDGNAYGLDFYTNYTNRLAITNGGNIGIGTINPTERLHVNGSIRVADDASIFGLDQIVGFNDLRLAGDPTGGIDLFISGAGDVGIGTQAPAEKLHVKGYFLRVDGGGNELAYLGGDGRANDIELGSLNPSVGSVVLYNRGTSKLMRLDVATLGIHGGGDLAEPFDVSAGTNTTNKAATPQIKPGMVVSIDPANPGKLVLSTQAYDRRVAGIISGAGGVKPGMVMSQEGTLADGQHPVALTGRVYCWVDASQGAIEPGDLLTTSNIPGYAMKVTNHAKAQGAIIGKAMTSLKSGQGLVLVLVTLQ